VEVVVGRHVRGRPALWRQDLRDRQGPRPARRRDGESRPKSDRTTVPRDLVIPVAASPSADRTTTSAGAAQSLTGRVVSGARATQTPGRGPGRGQVVSKARANPRSTGRVSSGREPFNRPGDDDGREPPGLTGGTTARATRRVRQVAWQGQSHPVSRAIATHQQDNSLPGREPLDRPADDGESHRFWTARTTARAPPSSTRNLQGASPTIDQTTDRADRAIMAGATPGQSGRTTAGAITRLDGTNGPAATPGFDRRSRFKRVGPAICPATIGLTNAAKAGAIWSDGPTTTNSGRRAWQPSQARAPTIDEMTDRGESPPLEEASHDRRDNRSGREPAIGGGESPPLEEASTRRVATL